jgi:hypothetical protein
MKKSGDILVERLWSALDVGEIPYKANRRAIHALDVVGDMDAGKRHISAMETGIDAFIEALEEVENAARNFVRDAKNALL